ncbi:MAG: glycosyltransferase family 2 protein [Bacilli bacterium]|nr:glycosyltransferase family 2 protein [Bacilli bacterium]
MKKLLSVVVPCFNEEESLPFFYKEICLNLKKIKNLNYELIFVDDGSNDNTINIIKEYSKINKKVRYISFSRNFGKEAAMLAGLEYSKGDYVTLMDADLQDPPSLLLEMYESIVNEGYDVVATRRINRKGEPRIRSFFAKKFYRIINKMSKIEMVDGARDFRLMKRKVADAIISMKEYNRYSKGIFSFVGFKTKWIAFENTERVAGKTKWSFFKLFKYAIEGIVGFSTFPLVLSALLGLLFCLLSFIMIIVIVIKTLVYGDPVSGWPSTICIIFFIGGVQLFVMGIIGQYLAKTYLETKNRPIYLIRETELDSD